MTTNTNFVYLVTFLVDDKKFVLTKNTFDNHPDSLLTKIVKSKTPDKYVVSDKYNNFYVDRDPEAFKYIVDVLRGYDIGSIEEDDERLYNKVQHDLKYFNLKPIIYLGDDLGDMLKEEYDENDTPMLDQFINVLEKAEVKAAEVKPDNNVIELISQGGGLHLMANLSNDVNMKQLVMEAKARDNVTMSDSVSDDAEFFSDGDEENNEENNEENVKTKSTARFIEIS